MSLGDYNYILIFLLHVSWRLQLYPDISESVFIHPALIQATFLVVLPQGFFTFLLTVAITSSFAIVDRNIITTCVCV